MRVAHVVFVTAVVVGLAGVTQPAAAQEFEPRAYAVTPAGLNFLAVGYGYATGAVFMDPGLPVEDVDSRVHVAFARYIRTFEMFDLPSKLKLTLPWSDGHWEGLYEGEFRTRDATGFADVRIAVETLFSGATVTTPPDAGGRTSDTAWGARLQIIVPTGTYDNQRAINLGSNRWTVVPEVGFSHALGVWSLEAAIASWIFADNSDYVGGLRLEQDPLFVAKLHAIRSIRPGFWWAIASGYGYGGRTTVDGVPRATIQRNWRLSAILAYPFSATQGMSVALASGGNFGAGTDADAITVAYQIAW